MRYHHTGATRMGIAPPALVPPASADGRDDVAIDQAVSIAAKVTMMLAAMINFFMLNIGFLPLAPPSPNASAGARDLGCATCRVCDGHHKTAL